MPLPQGKRDNLTRGGVSRLARSKGGPQKPYLSTSTNVVPGSYVTEDGLSSYTTEDGTQTYVTETA